jgi:hypothetical protein
VPWAGAQAQDAREQGPTEIEKCQTISKPGSYKLINNLKAGNNADCLVITASFVTIDLAGFTITGRGSPTGEGIRTTALSPGQLVVQTRRLLPGRPASRLLRFASDDSVSACHCEEYSDEAISVKVRTGGNHLSGLHH